MKKIILALLITAVSAFGANPAVELKLDINERDDPFTAPVHMGDTPLIRAYLYQAGARWQPGAGWGGQLTYGTDWEDSTSLRVISGTVNTSTNFIDFQLTAADVPTNGTFFSQVLLSISTGGRFIFGDGQIIVDKNPSSGSASSLVLVDMPSGTQNGQLAYYSTNQNSWVTLDPDTAGLFLKTGGSNSVPSWDTPVGAGDVVGPASAVDERIAVYDSTTGKLIKDGGSTIAEILALIVPPVTNTTTTTATALTNFEDLIDGAWKFYGAPVGGNQYFEFWGTNAVGAGGPPLAYINVKKGVSAGWDGIDSAMTFSFNNFSTIDFNGISLTDVASVTATGDVKADSVTVTTGGVSFATMNMGKLGGTNGVYYTRNGTNYWITFGSTD